VDPEILIPAGMEKIFLLPGELCVSPKPIMMATLLGSCVAVCVYNRQSNLAGMNHFIRDHRADSPDSYGKFGDTSTSRLIQRLQESDNDKSAGRYEAKIFGGCGVVGKQGLGADTGTKNIAVARWVLKEFKIPVVQEDVGGKQGRRIYFNTKTFDVQVLPIVSRSKDLSDRKIRVLIVDDSEIVRKILRKDIESSQDLEVCAEASNAFEARDKLLEFDPDVISLDIIMQGMSGLDFLEKVMKYRPKPVVIVSTIAKAGSPIAKRAKALGAVGVIDKEDLGLYKGPKGVRLKYLAVLKAAATSILKGTI